MDYNKTWAGIVKQFLFRLLFIIVIEQGLHMKWMDMLTALFYGFLAENIFMNQLERYIIDVVIVCYHWKALYGLK